MEQIVASKLALAQASAEERILATRHQRALRSLTAMRYRAKAARDAGDTKRARRAEARVQRQAALVATMRAAWQQSKDRLSMRKVAFRDKSRRLVGPPEPAPRLVMREVKAEHAHACSLLDEIEAVLRTMSEFHEATPTSHRGASDRKIRCTLLNAENALLEAKLYLASAIAHEQALTKRHAKCAAEADEWRRISADSTAVHGDDRQAAILAPGISRMEREAAAVEHCLAAQRHVVVDIQNRIATLVGLVAEARQKRRILAADRSLAVARIAVAAARANAHGARAKASFVKAKECLAIVMADEKRLAHCLEEARARGAATDEIETRLVAQQQAKDELLGALRPLVYLDGPAN